MDISPTRTILSTLLAFQAPFSSLWLTSHWISSCQSPRNSFFIFLDVLSAVQHTLFFFFSA